MLLMCVIMLTGNYNFFNFLTIILLMIVLDDEFILKYIPRKVFLILDIKVPLNSILKEIKS